MRRWTFLCSLLLLSSLAGQVWADGFHYEITVDSQLQEDADGKLSGLRMQWLYDPTVSKMLLEGEDLGADKRAATLQTIAADIVGDLHAYSYFTRLTLAGQALPTAKVSDYQLELGADQRLQLSFLLPLASPQALAGKRLDIAMLDPAGTGVLKHQNASHLILGAQTGALCTLTLEQNTDYTHSEPAQIAHLQCR